MIIFGKRSKLIGVLLAGAAALPAQAQTASTPADGARIEQKLDELRAMRQDMQRQMGALQHQMGEFDSQIGALEAELHPGAQATATATSQATTDAAAIGGSAAIQQAAPPAGEDIALDTVARARPSKSGTFDPNAGYVLVDDDLGRLNFGFTTYARYLNQNALNATYVDSFGRVLPIDRRNEVQLYKASLNFKGWLFDPKFQYLLFVWTNNANQGNEAQVVLAGFLRYNFAKWLGVSAGIMPLPTTRTTNYSFPKWLRHDNRPMADEFYRGSYTSGIDVFGEIADGLEYRAMIGNNLSTLGVSSKELDNKFNTVSAALWWMPTTHEFGSSNGFGDYDYHEKPATLIGLHYTHSRETAQGQPSEDDFENSQIRLTDGTLLFSPDPFTTGGKIEEATYAMATIDAGVKYKGFSLEAQWYWRRVDTSRRSALFPSTRLRTMVSCFRPRLCRSRICCKSMQPARRSGARTAIRPSIRLG